MEEVRSKSQGATVLNQKVLGHKRREWQRNRILRENK